MVEIQKQIQDAMARNKEYFGIKIPTYVSKFYNY